MAKLGIVPPSGFPPLPYTAPPAVTEAAPTAYPPIPAGAIKYAPTEASYYEPVTSYRRIRQFDPETQNHKDVMMPVTTYILRGPSSPKPEPVGTPPATCTPPALPSVSQTPFLFDSPY